MTVGIVLCYSCALPRCDQEVLRSRARQGISETRKPVSHKVERSSNLALGTDHKLCRGKSTWKSPKRAAPQFFDLRLSVFRNHHRWTTDATGREQIRLRIASKKVSPKANPFSCALCRSPGLGFLQSIQPSADVGSNNPIDTPCLSLDLTNKEVIDHIKLFQ